MVWTRQLSLLFGATVYNFSLILAVFLTGIGGGSLVGAWLARRAGADLALAWCQLGLVAALPCAAYMRLRDSGLGHRSFVPAVTPRSSATVDTHANCSRCRPPTRPGCSGDTERRDSAP